ncbi:MAG: hypothetical protein KC457_24255, partial [Myxococcales bacterium]|nr:hypothetical protein [Myxococcales bacterium]
MRRSRVLAPVLLALMVSVGSSGCFLFGTTSNPSAGAAQNQAQMRANLEQQRASAKAGDPQAQVMFAATLLGTLGNESAKAAYGEVDWDTMVAEAEAMLDEQAAGADENTAMQAMSLKAELQAVTGRGAEAVATWQAAHDAKASFLTAVGLMLMSQKTGVALADPVGFCGENRSLAEGDMQLYQYMQTCYALNPAGSMDAALPWA